METKLLLIIAKILFLQLWIKYFDSTAVHDLDNIKAELEKAERVINGN
jgi:hypothetical protein